MSVNNNTLIAQANLRRKCIALKELDRAMLRDQVQIAIIQEPCSVENKVFIWNKKIFNCYYNSSSGRPRTCILVKKHLKAMLIPQISTADAVSIV
jgi:hypothetical protein